MPARRAVIIGCGTTGCEIAAQVYVNWKKYAQETGEYESKVQFLLIDTQDPLRGVEGLEELYYRGDYLMIGFPRANALLQAMRENDGFFNKWWPENHDYIPSLYPGAGTTPVNGRLAFWARAGDPYSENSFIRKFEERILRTQDQGGQPAQTLVIIVSTLCGGTGAGIFLDIAQYIKTFTQIGTEIHGVFLMDDIVNMRACRDVHKKISANVYGSLIALNYWQTPKYMREIDLGNFIQTPHVTLEGNDPPFDICYLISRENESGITLESIQDYQDLAADAISTILFGKAHQFNDWMINISYYLNEPLNLGNNPTPQQFSSISTCKLTYHPEKAIAYLSSEIAIRAVEAFMAVPERYYSFSDENAQKFLIENHLRELGYVEQGERIREVTDQIKAFVNREKLLYPRMQKIISDLFRTDVEADIFKTLTNPTINSENIKQALCKFKEDVEAGLYDKLLNEVGVNYKELMQSNRIQLYERAVNRHVEFDISLPKQSTGLLQLVKWMLKGPEAHLAGTKRLLEQINKEIVKYREGLEIELRGDNKQRIVGDQDSLEMYERSLDTALQTLVKRTGSIFKSKRRKAAKTFEEAWWKPWLRLKINIMAKIEAIRLYQELEKEIAWLHNCLNKDLAEILEIVRHDHVRNKTLLYESHESDHFYQIYHREEEAISDGGNLLDAYGDEVAGSVNLVKGDMSKLIVDQIDKLIAHEESSSDISASVKSDLRDSIHSLIQNEGEKLFGDELRSLSLWESMVLGMRDTNPNNIKKHIEARLTEIEGRCEPHWQIDARFQAMGLVSHLATFYSYDYEVKQSFENKYQVRLSVPQVDGRVGVNAFFPDMYGGDHQVTAYEFSILKLEAGVPLHFIKSVNAAQYAFERQLEISRQPCIVDRRYMQLVRRGLPTWGPEIG